MKCHFNFTTQKCRLFVCFICLGMAFLVGCTEEAVDDSTLALSTLPTTLKVGDTSQSATCSKSSRDAAGRMKTTENYLQFTLVSEDTTVLKPVAGRRLVALKSGTTKVHAKDVNRSLSSDAQTVKVE